MTTVYVYESDTGNRHRMDEGMELLIGRSMENHIVIDNSSVSRHHAAVGLKSGEIYIRDAGSTNGTVVNGERMQAVSTQTLRIGDEFIIGIFSFKVLDEAGLRAMTFKGGNKPGDTSIMSPGH